MLQLVFDRVHQFFNNHSFLYKIFCVSCYDHGNIPNKEDNNSSLSGSSCSSTWPVSHNSNNGNCTLAKFNFVNNADSNEYFWLSPGNHKRIKESVIVFKSTTKLKRLNYYHSGATLSVEECFVIASGTIQIDKRATLTARTTTAPSAPTHTPFHSHPNHKHCWNPDKILKVSGSITQNLDSTKLQTYQETSQIPLENDC